MKGLVFACLALLSASCFAQTAADVRALAEIQNRAILEKAEWNAAKKLSVFPVTAETAPQKSSPDPHKVEKDAICELSYWRFKVLSIVDKRNSILQLGLDTTIWLENFEADLVDDQTVHLIGWLKCTGTKSYNTAAGGTRTVKSFRFITRDEVDAEPEKYPSLNTPPPDEYETWTSKKGVTLKAKYLGYKSGVLLETKDGKKLNVSMKDFSEGDQAKLRDRIKQERESKVKK